MKPDSAVIDSDDEGIRLDRWFKRHRLGTPHALIARWARSGLIQVDGKRSTISERLSAGQTLTMPFAATPPSRPTARTRQPLSEEDTDFARSLIIHQDASALVLAKPPGLATQGGTKSYKHIDGLLDAMQFNAPVRPKLVHRLDKDTSGVLLIARSARSAACFAKSFATRSAQKTYWALIIGVPDIQQGEINLPLAKEPGTGGEKMCISPQDQTEKIGQTARTRYRVIERAGTRAAWVELQPLTGRTHQLRVHMAAIGHPIVGDSKYGGKEAFLTGMISRKLHLHARRLRIEHPDGGALDIKAPLPEHFAASLDAMGFDLTLAEMLDTPLAGDARNPSARKTHVKPPEKSPEKSTRKPSGKPMRKTPGKIPSTARRGARRGQNIAKPSKPPTKSGKFAKSGNPPSRKRSAPNGTRNR